MSPIVFVLTIGHKHETADHIIRQVSSVDASDDVFDGRGNTASLKHYSTYIHM